MKVVFFGSDPWFSLPIFKALMGANHEMQLVVTKGNLFDGRSGRVIQGGLGKNISLANLKKKTSSAPDVIILAAFGPPFLTKAALRWPKYGALNVHASLLPRWRGAGPVFAALNAGDRETGVSIMKMTAEVDRGPILGQKRVRIKQSFDTRETLTKKLALFGGKLLLETLNKIENEQIVYTAQPVKSPTPVTKKLSKSSGLIDWSKPPEEIERFIRAVTPWPSAYTDVKLKVKSEKLKVKRLKILKAHLDKGKLVIDEVQLPGKNPISYRQFLAGHPNEAFWLF